MIETYQWQDRKNLYYDKWEWSFSYRMETAWATRELDHELLRHQRMTSRVIRGLDQRQWDDISHHIDFMLARQEPYKRCVSWNWVYLYTNSEQLIEDCRALSYINPCQLHRARVTRPKDVILLQNPRHRFRSYFYSKMISRDSMQSMRRYLENNKHIRVCDGMQSIWTHYDRIPQKDRCWMQRYYFLDHDHAQDLTLLQMIVPGIIRCTIPIQKAPDAQGVPAK